jgi:hypothetical protein
MAMGEPRIRAAQTQSLLTAISRLGPTERSKITALIDPRTTEAILAELPMAWVPMGQHMHVSDAAREVLGSQGLVRLFRETMLSSFDRPLLRTFLNMTFGIFGVTPGGLIKRSNKIYDHVTRELGTLSATLAEDSRAQLTLVGFPAQQFNFDCYVDGLAGCLEATLAFASAEHGKVRPLHQESASGNVVYDLSW